MDRYARNLCVDRCVAGRTQASISHGGKHISAWATAGIAQLHAARRPQRLSHRLVLALPSWARQWRSFSRERAAYTALGCAPPPKRRAGVAARRCCPSQAVARDPGPARAPLTKAHQNQSRNASHKRRGGQEAEALPSCTTAIRASAGTAIRPADGCNRRPQYVPAALLGA